jgi:hypothetical protein
MIITLSQQPSLDAGAGSDWIAQKRTVEHWSVAESKAVLARA